MTTTVTTTNETAPPMDIEILRTGTHQGIAFDTAALDQLVENFSRLRAAGAHDVPLKVAHNEEQPLASYDLALGWVKSLRRVGDRLVATVVDTPKALREAVRLGRWRKCSIEAYRAWERTPAEANLKTGVRGLALSAVAILGSSVPAVHGLADIPRLLADEHGAASADDIIRVEFAAPELSLQAQVEQLGQRINEAGERLNRMVRMTEENKLRLTSFSPQTADEIGGRGHTWMSAVEAVLSALGLNRDDVVDRRRASELVRRERADLYPGDADYQRVITEFSPTASEPDAARRAAPDGISNPAAGQTWKTSPNRPPIESRSAGASQVPHESRAGDRSSWGTRLQYTEPEALASRFSEAARGEGITMKEATPEQRDRIGRLLESEAPLYGPHAVEAERLGGVDRFHALRGLSKTHGLNLDRSRDRQTAERMLWSQVATTVRGAKCFDEALAAMERRETQLNFSERADRTAAVRQLAKERPDLVCYYGSPRGEERPTMMAEGDHLTDSERAVRFEEEVVSRLRAQDLPDTPLNRGAAAQHIASVRGDLCPTYDLVRERR